MACGSSASTTSNVTAPADARCEATVGSSSVSVGPSGGTGTLSIGVARECSWRVASPVGWVTFTTPVEGQGDGSVGYRVGENPDPVARQAQLSVADRPVTVAQGAAPCRYAIGGAPEALSATGGQASIDLATHAVCDWTAASQSAWATVSPASGRGGARLAVNVSPNSGDARPVVVTIAGERVEMTQHAASTPAPTPPAPTPPAPTPPGPTPPVPAPVPVSPIELEGEIDRVAGSCPTKTFRLDDYTVYTTADTTYERGSCNNVGNDADVEYVRGWLMSDGRVRADRIRFDKD
jgi:hypothetical protein